MSETTKTKRNRCECGKAMSKYASCCKACDAARTAARVAEALAIVSTGRCPSCGQNLRRNLSLTGWYQCAGYGAEGFRAADSKPCSFQIFTE